MTGRWAPSWFGQGLLTRPSSATAVPDRRRVTWRPVLDSFKGYFFVFRGDAGGLFPQHDL